MVDIRELTINQQPESVTVLELSELDRWLRRRRGVLTPEQVAAVVVGAERPEMWRASPSNADWPGALAGSRDWVPLAGWLGRPPSPAQPARAVTILTIE